MQYYSFSCDRDNYLQRRTLKSTGCHMEEAPDISYHHKLKRIKSSWGITVNTKFVCSTMKGVLWMQRGEMQLISGGIQRWILFKYCLNISIKAFQHYSLSHSLLCPEATPPANEADVLKKFYHKKTINENRHLLPYHIRDAVPCTKGVFSRPITKLLPKLNSY